MHSLCSSLSKGIIHQDVKLSNFLYNKEIRLGKLIDFGLVNNSSKYHKAHKHGSLFKKPCTTKKLRNIMLCDMKQAHYRYDTSVCVICMSRRCKIWNH